MNKRVQVRILPTEQLSYPIERWGEWLFNTLDGIQSNREPKPVGHHIYLTTEEDPAIGEIVFHLNINELCVADEFMVSNPDCKKIVATTNPELWEKFEPVFKGMSGIHEIWKNKVIRKGIPKIGDDFVQAYVREQGMIKEVMLEYEHFAGYADANEPMNSNGDIYIPGKLKLHPNGTVIISPVKQQLFNRQQVLSILEHYDRIFKLDTFAYTQAPSFTEKQWFDKNYPE